MRDRAADLTAANPAIHLVDPRAHGMLDLTDLDSARQGLSAATLRGLTCGSHRKIKLVSFPPDDEAEEALEPRLAAIFGDFERHLQDHGTGALTLGFPWISGRLGRDLVVQAPLFLFPVTLEAEEDRGRFSGWQLEGRPNGDSMRVNRWLLLALRRFARKKLSPERLEELAWKTFYEGGLHAAPDDPQEYLTRLVPDLLDLGLIVEPTRAHPADDGDPTTAPLAEVPAIPEDPGRFIIAPTAVLGRFGEEKAAILLDHIELLRELQRDEEFDRAAFWARAAVGREDAAQSATRVLPAVQTDRGPKEQVDLWPVLPWDGEQEAVLSAVIGGSDTVVEAPGGTGKTQTIVNLAAACQALGRGLIVVSDRREGLDDIHARLDELGLAEGVARVYEGVTDREDVYRTARKRLRRRPARSEGAVPTHEASLATLLSDAAWFDTVHHELIGDGSSTSPFSCYVRRLADPAEVDEDLITSLPPNSPEDLPGLLEPMDAYVAARTGTLVPSEAVPERPSYARVTEGDLVQAQEVMIPAAVEAVRAARAWSDVEQSSGIPLQRAAEKHDDLKALHEFAHDAPPLGHAGWEAVDRSRRWLASPGARRGPDPLAGDRRRLERYLERRAKTQGRFPRAPRSTWDELKADLDAWDEFEENVVRVINPSYHALKKRLQEALKRERLNPDDVARGAKRLKRRLGLARLATATAAGMVIAPLDENALRKAPDDVLRGALEAAGVGLDYARRWQGAPETHAATMTVAMPRNRAKHDELMARISHGLAAARIYAGTSKAKAGLEPWIGPSAEGWVDYAYQQGRPDLLTGWFASEVVERFPALAEADRLAASVEEADPGLARIAVKLTQAGDTNPTRTLRAAYAERWIREAEAGAPHLAEFTEGADRRRRKRYNEAGNALIEGSVAAVKEKIAARIHTLPEVTTALEEALTDTGRSPSLKTILPRFWERGLRTLVPVWLCTPEAAAALPPGEHFDIVVFDEAHALPTERALPAARRARTALVFGDSSLPGADETFNLFRRARAGLGATRFSFDHGAAFPHLTDARRAAGATVHSAPLFHPRPKPPALECVRIAGSWSRRGNVVEADAAAELLGQLLEAQPEASIGIVTATETQQTRLLARIRRRRLRSRSYRATLGAATNLPVHRRPFVRTLDGLAGEARDIILFAPGAATEGDGAEPRGLGPLAGRVHMPDTVLAAARLKTIVLSSLDPALHLSEGDPAPGLRAYLEQALHLTRGGRREFPSRLQHPDARTLADSVAEAIAGLGYPVERDVGAGDLRVDVAVRSPDRPRPFLLAILLDGHDAAWAHHARTREHTRWAMLRAAGWVVTSVSARSWLRSREEVLERLEAGIEKSAAARRPRPERPPALGPLPSGALED